MRSLCEGILLTDSRAKITKCIFKNNRYGLYVYHRSSPTITDCTISDNEYTGITIIEGHPVISNCAITNNGIYGIGEYSETSDPEKVENCYLYNPSGVDYWDEAKTNYIGDEVNTVPEVSGCTAKDPSAGKKM